MKTIYVGALALILSWIIYSCRHDYIVFPGSGNLPEDDLLESTCDPDSVYFTNTILPLVVSSCATTGCHDAASHADGIILTDYTSILETGKVKPGNLNDSEFFEVLTDDEDIMPPPPLSPLNQSQIDQIRKWIVQGAKENGCTDGCDTTNVTFSGTIWPLMQSYCTGCHSATSPGGGIVIEEYSDVILMANNGTLMGTVRYESGYAPMPPNAALANCRIDQLQKWIDDGMPNN